MQAVCVPWDYIGGGLRVRVCQWDGVQKGPPFYFSAPVEIDGSQMGFYIILDLLGEGSSELKMNGETTNKCCPIPDKGENDEHWAYWLNKNKDCLRPDGSTESKNNGWLVSNSLLKLCSSCDVIAKERFSGYYKMGVNFYRERK